jgi:hypothetical protein
VQGGGGYTAEDKGKIYLLVHPGEDKYKCEEQMIIDIY